MTMTMTMTSAITSAADTLLRYTVRAAAVIRGVFVCINCGVTPRTFLRILHVDTSPHPAPRILHDTVNHTLVHERD